VKVAWCLAHELERKFINRSAEDGVIELCVFVLIVYNQQTTRPSWVSNKIFLRKSIICISSLSCGNRQIESKLLRWRARVELFQTKN